MPLGISPLSPAPTRTDAQRSAGPSQATPAVGLGDPFARQLSAESSRRVQASRTPLSTETARSAIAGAYRELVGTPLSESGSAILAAHWAHETGHGAAMYNYNFGGIKGVGPSGLTVAQKTREGYGESERRIVDNFRAYSSVDEGAKDYVKLLLSRYGAAVASAEQGDPAGFVRGLKAKGYFTGDPAAYERNVASIANRILGSSGDSRLATAPTQQAAQVPAALAISPATNVAPTSAPRRTDATTVGLWQTTPTPTALLEVAGVFGAADRSTDSVAELSATRALAMSDEITRAALRLATSDREDDSRPGATARVAGWSDRR